MLMNARLHTASFCLATLLSLGACSLLDNKPQQGLLPNGSRYEGKLVEGLLQGPGTLLGADGSRYEGEFSSGVFAGDGKQVFATGDSYSGQFANGLPNGRGKFSFADGSHYDGEVKDGQMHGQGVFTAVDGGRYEGNFSAGILNGEGSFTAASDAAASDESAAGDKRPQTYRGQFVAWLYDGKGELKLVDGSYYSGDFKQGNYSGKGVFTDANGDRYSGEFANGLYHGKGSYRYAKAQQGISEFNGVWRYGKLVEADRPGVIFDAAALVETALYNQIELIDAQLVKIDTERSGQVDVFFVGVAGDGNQEVFLRELNTVREVMAEHFNTGNRHILLANHRETANELPMATQRSLDYTLEAVGQMMGDEDILFLYMSSHGSKPEDGKGTEFLLAQSGMELHNLSPAALKAILDKHHLPYQVVVISACYSGGFVPPLRADHRLVITSSATDNTSFGCSDDEVMTYFGDALFNHGLNKTADISKAFRLAKQYVTRREMKKAFPPSEPQISRAPALLQQWQKLDSNRDAP